MADFPILTAIIGCALAAMVLTVVIPGRMAKLIKVVNAICALASVVLSVVLWVLYDPNTPGFQFVESMPWVPHFGIQYQVGVDGISVLLTMLTALVFFTGVLTMWHLDENNRAKEYFAFMALLVVGVFGVFLSLDLFAFFFFYEVAVLPMYPLIIIWGSTDKEYAGMKLMIYLMGGSALLFPALVGLYYAAGVDSWSILEMSKATIDTETQVFLFPFLFIGFGILAGMFPFHSWSPAGHVAAPTAVSMLHAGVLMKLGAYGILRVAMTLLPEGAVAWLEPFAILATFNIVYGAFVAMKQTDFKYVIGFSSVSHMGIVLLGLCTLGHDGVNGAVFQMFAHGVMTALFFSAVGFIYEQTHDRDIRHFGGLLRRVEKFLMETEEPADPDAAGVIVGVERADLHLQRRRAIALRGWHMNHDRFEQVTHVAGFDIKSVRSPALLGGGINHGKIQGRVVSVKGDQQIKHLGVELGSSGVGCREDFPARAMLRVVDSWEGGRDGCGR